jgi:cytochrome P450
MRRPFYILRDPDLIMDITVKKFDHFTDHASVVHDKLDPILSNLLIFMKGQKWKNMR